LALHFAAEADALRERVTRLGAFWVHAYSMSSPQDRKGLRRRCLSDCFRGLRWRGAMAPFFVQIKCQLGKAYEVAGRLADAEIASEIYSTAGDYDLLVKFYVDDGTDIGHFINEKVQTIPGIQNTHTIITFKAF
jgi:DNA-binding Lrp family transcriptional regulator